MASRSAATRGILWMTGTYWRLRITTLTPTPLARDCLSAVGFVRDGGREGSNRRHPAIVPLRKATRVARARQRAPYGANPRFEGGGNATGEAGLGSAGQGTARRGTAGRGIGKAGAPTEQKRSITNGNFTNHARATGAVATGSSCAI